MNMKYTITSVTLLMLLFIPTSLAHAAEVLCTRPPVTQALFFEMDAYEHVVKDVLEKQGCYGAVSLFGIANMGPVTASDQAIIDQFFSTFLNADNPPYSLKAREAEFMQLLNNQPAQWSADVQEMKQKLTSIHNLLRITMTDECQKKVPMQKEKIGGTVVDIPLYESVQAHYRAYYTIYGYLLFADVVGYSKRYSAPPTQEALVQEIIGKYRTSTENPFFYFADYRKDAMSQCVAKEMGLERINQSLEQLQDAWKETQKSVNELAKTAQTMSTININVTKLGKLMGMIAAPEAERALILQEIRTGLETGAMEVAQRLKNMFSSLRINGKPLRDFSFGTVQEGIVEIDGTNGTVKIQSQSQILQSYLQKKSDAAFQKEQALEEYKAKMYDTFGVYSSTENVMQQLSNASLQLDRANVYIEAAEDAFSYVCSNHLPSANNDCGEKKN